MQVTRIAPSPTGDMHIGTARTAYFNYLAARSSQGKFILRIDDTDLARSSKKCIDVILKTMDFLGLEYDELKYQSDNFGMYKDIANDLCNSKMAEVHEGCVRLSHEIDQPKGPAKLVLIKSDGSPSYHFASVIDDWSTDINHIIRGVDHESNEVKQRFIWDTVNGVYPAKARDFPLLSHVGLITEGGKKLSKRDGAASMLAYQEAGYLPGALLNYMLRLGWGPSKDDKSTNIINKERAISMFLTEGRMKKSPSGLDKMKLDWYNKKYRNMQRT